MYLCRCSTCARHQSVLDADLDHEVCPCGGQFFPDAAYHPENRHARAFDPPPAYVPFAEPAKKPAVVVLVAPLCATCDGQRKFVIAAKAGVRTIPCPDCSGPTTVA